MSDQFTSVQWDRDEGESNVQQQDDTITVPEPINEEAEEESQSLLITADEPQSQSQTQTEEHEIMQDQKNIISNDLKMEENTGAGDPFDSHKQDMASSTENDNDDDEEEDDTGSGLLPQAALSQSKEPEEEEEEEEFKQATPIPEYSEPVKPSSTPVIGQQAYIIPDEDEGQSQVSLSISRKPAKDFYIHTVVSAPITETDGQNQFTSFLIQIDTDCDSFQKKKFQLRRRYSDFHFLYECLTNDLPTLIIPPLPNKQRLEYIKGGRFTEEFTAKRAISLNNFLNRVCKHPILKQSQIFHIFLEDSDYWNTYKSNLKITSTSLDPANSTAQNLESMTDYIMNSFKKPSYESSHKKEFQDIHDRSTKLQENLKRIDLIYGKVLGKQQDISDDFSRFSDEFSKLNILLTNDIDGKNKPDEMDENSKMISSQFDKFSKNLKQISTRMYHLNHEVEYNYLTSLKDLEHYINQLKSLIKLKENKSMDYEALTGYLEKYRQERDYLIGGGSVTHTTEGTLNFLHRKFESITGLSGNHQHGNLTNERIEKLDSRIQVLEKAQKSTFEIFEKFESDILEEYQLFEKIKNEEINESLNRLSKSYLEYYTSLSNDWQHLDLPGDSHPVTSFPNQLSEDDDLFTYNDVLKNNELLGESLKKIQGAEL